MKWKIPRKVQKIHTVKKKVQHKHKKVCKKNPKQYKNQSGKVLSPSKLQKIV